MKKQHGFTLIELLIVIAIIGILAAIAIPNLLNAVQRGKQKRTLSDMRTLAVAIEAYNVDHSTYPSAACNGGIYTDAGAVLAASSFTCLTPTYVAIPPMRDGWSNAMTYSVDSGNYRYNIISYGRNGTADALKCGTTSDFNDDILFTNGGFVQWPEGAQN